MQTVETTTLSPNSINAVLAAGWISMNDAVPPYNTGVITTDRNGIVSFGRIHKITMGHRANGGEPVVSYEWKSVEPYVSGVFKRRVGSAVA